MKNDRIQQMTIDDGVKEIERYTDECIIELGRSEEAFTFKRNELDSSINHALRTYREANPEYLKAKQLPLAIRIALRPSFFGRCPAAHLRKRQRQRHCQILMNSMA
jgi:hypothetical protein